MSSGYFLTASLYDGDTLFLSISVIFFHFFY